MLKVFFKKWFLLTCSRTLQGHGHWVNVLALNTDYVMRTGAFDPAKATLVHEHTGRHPHLVMNLVFSLRVLPLYVSVVKCIMIERLKRLFETYRHCTRGSPGACLETLSSSSGFGPGTIPCLVIKYRLRETFLRIERQYWDVLGCFVK